MTTAVIAIIAVVAGVGVGALIAWVLAGRIWQARGQARDIQLRAEAEQAVASVREELLQTQGRLSSVEAERSRLAELQASSTSLDDKLTPLKESLESFREQVRRADRERAEADGQLRTQIQQVQQGYVSLESATRQLVAAMASGQSRGQWGEMQLEQLLEHAGMVEGVHFRRQDTRADTRGIAGEGASRPDIVIMLPGGGEILIDAKFPFDAYWKALEVADGDDASVHLIKHADDVLSRAKELSNKRYHDSALSPDFVVMFLPLESLLSTALDTNGLLLEQTFQRNVVLATPTTLLGLLRTITFGYQRKLMADNAEEIREAGAEMLKRLTDATSHLDKMRRGLNQAIDGYNKFVGSYDSRVMVQARRMSDLGVSAAAELEAPAEILELPRESKSIEGSADQADS
jgi:DNA recombination protein RmuC